MSGKQPYKIVVQLGDEPLMTYTLGIDTPNKAIKRVHANIIKLADHHKHRIGETSESLEIDMQAHSAEALKLISGISITTEEGETGG